MSFTGTDRYELIRKLGEGGMGIVYEAYDRTRAMRIALKLLRNVDAESLYRFKREFRALHSLSHPNIINLYELVGDEGHWFLTMEVVRGDDLIAYVRAQPDPEDSGRIALPMLDAEMEETATAPSEVCTPVSENLEVEVTGEDTELAENVQDADDEIIEDLRAHATGLPTPPPVPAELDSIVDIERLRIAFGQLADALHALHSANMVHRDLKPSNVLVTDEDRVVLMDFGIVGKVLSATDSEPGEMAMGTPHYMAPEQARGKRPMAAADWYGFGVLLYLALTGRLPYEGPRALVVQAKQDTDPHRPGLFTADIPPDIESLCLALLAREPTARPTGSQVLHQLGIEARDAATSGEFAAMYVGDELFVGRRRELGVLRKTFARVVGGGTVFVFVEGPSGIGKSSLIERFVREVEMTSGQKPLVMSGRCHERESLMHKAFDGVADDLTRCLLEMSADERKAVLPAEVGMLVQLFPVIRRVPECNVMTALISPSPPRSVAVEVFRELLESLARTHPIIILTEDVQWADQDSLDLIAELLHPPAPPRLMVIATVLTSVDGGEDLAPGHLNDFIGSLTGQLDCARIRLAPLSDPEQREFMTKMSTLPEYQGVLQHLDAPLWKEAAGNPMLLAELARSSQEVLDELSRSGADLDLKNVVWGRVARLPENARKLMDCIALAEGPLPLRILAHACSLSSIDSERAAAVLRVRHLARTSRTDHEPWLVAYHGRVQAAIRARLSDEEIRELHRRIALALETWEEAPVAYIAEHWLEAGVWAQAAIHLCRAGRLAAERQAFERADDLYRLALALMPDDSDDQRLEIARCQVWIGLAERMRILEDREEALELLGYAQEVATRHALLEELAAIHHLRGNIYFSTNDIEGCFAEHRTAMNYARRAGSPRREAQALSGLGDAYYLIGRLNTAYEIFVKCILLCREHGFDDIEVANLPMRGITRFFHNQLATALQDGLNAAAAAARVGHTRAEVVARGVVGWILFEMGHLSQARSELENALKLTRRLGTRRFEPDSLTFLARIMAHRGHQARALKLIEESLTVCRETEMSYAGPMALGTLAMITDDREVRQRSWDEARKVLAGGAPSHNHLYFYRDAIDAALAASDIDAALRFAGALEDYTREEALPWSRYFVARGRALAAHISGHGDGELLRRLLGEARASSLHTAAQMLERAVTDAE